MPSSAENLVSTVQIRPPATAEAEGHSHAELLARSLELVSSFCIFFYELSTKIIQYIA
jgi:hypothetical protein